MIEESRVELEQTGHLSPSAILKQIEQSRVLVLIPVMASASASASSLEALRS